LFKGKAEADTFVLVLEGREATPALALLVTSLLLTPSTLLLRKVLPLVPLFANDGRFSRAFPRHTQATGALLEREEKTTSLRLATILSSSSRFWLEREASRRVFRLLPQTNKELKMKINGRQRATLGCGFPCPQILLSSRLVFSLLLALARE
jgi:hypothetical protein